MTSHDARLRARTDDLDRAVQLAGDRLDPQVREQVLEVIAGVRQRLALGVDHTVIALAGGTGSGKSSLFNGITRLQFADAGARRPTTARVAACAWSEAATALLDWLQVDPERRITRGGELDGVDESPLTGLVLLDLPDHDSIKSAHRAVVDRIVPLVDVLVWVVDPQKYADDALHTGYLQNSQGLEGSMVVAVNQIDTVPESRRSALGEDMARLLEADGLTGVHVMMVSAQTGEGLSALRQVLERAVARRSVAAGRAARELDRAGEAVLSQTPGEVPRTMSQAVEREAATIAQACGIDAVAGQVSAAVRRGYGNPEFAPPQAESIASSRTRWLSRAGTHLKPGWRAALESAVVPGSQIASDLVSALRTVPLDTRGPHGARLVRRGADLGFVVAGLLALLGGLGAFGILEIPQGAIRWLALAASGVFVLAVLAVVVGRRRRMRLARLRLDQVRRLGHEAVQRVVESTLARPTQVLLDEHRRVRELAQAAREPAPYSTLSEPARSTTAQPLSTQPQS